MSYLEEPGDLFFGLLPLGDLFLGGLFEDALVPLPLGVVAVVGGATVAVSTRGTFLAGGDAMSSFLLACGVRFIAFDVLPVESSGDV